MSDPQVERNSVLTVRLQFPETHWRGIKPPRQNPTPDDDRVMAFLDKMEQKHGPKSVLYGR